MRALVTGAAGFAGQHLCAALRARGHEVVAAGHQAEHPVDFRLLDLVAELFSDTNPDVVYHLAGTSSVAEMRRGPTDTQTENIVHPLLNVLECAGRRRVLYVSTCHVYGSGPTDESTPMRPTELYGAARASAEAMARRHVDKGGDVVIARAFHHTGPGQDRRFALSDWAHRYAAGERAIPVGNLDVRRDYFDVRDAVEGYQILAERGEAGQAYNLCSGTSRSMRELFERLCPGAEPVVDESRQRGKEVAEIAGSPARAEALGWSRRHPLQGTLDDLRAWAAERVANGLSAARAPR